ncbi:MAG: polysaccharide deacetylase family protein [Deltaproteobacteria bacterium]|nr:polysaccharide deacetylase family protein [Deltaproteobacteria bacterium]
MGTIRRAVLIAVLLPGLAGPLAAAESQGSRILLHTLWTQRELAGSAADHAVSRPSAVPVDLSPPAVTVPRLKHPPLCPAQTGVIRRVAPDDGVKVAALTFDLCERASNRTGYRTEIVNFLRRGGIPATFFACGKWLRSHPEKALQLMADPLFELGNHSWNHANLALTDGIETRDQVLWTQAQYEILRDRLRQRAAAAGLEAEMAGVPEALRLFRLPYGRNSAATLESLSRLGLPVIQWDVLGEFDGGAWPPEKIAARAAARVRPGSIILMHANAVPPKTHQVLPLLVKLLEQRGWRFVTVGRLLEMGEPETVPEGFFEKPGDNAVYDRAHPDQGLLHKK